MHLGIADNLAPYHGLCGHQPHFQWFFSNTVQLISFLLRSIALHKEKSTGNKVEWAWIFAEFSNSTRTNSFHRVKVGNKSIQAEVKYRKIRINCQEKRCFMGGEAYSGVLRHPVNLCPPPKLQSTHHNVMLMWQLRPKSNSCIIPWIVSMEISDTHLF